MVAYFFPQLYLIVHILLCFIFSFCVWQHQKGGASSRLPAIKREILKKTDSIQLVNTLHLKKTKTLSSNYTYWSSQQIWLSVNRTALANPSVFRAVLSVCFIWTSSSLWTTILCVLLSYPSSSLPSCSQGMQTGNPPHTDTPAAATHRRNSKSTENWEHILEFFWWLQSICESMRKECGFLA